jgi:hypothetical protein
MCTSEVKLEERIAVKYNHVQLSAMKYYLFRAGHKGPALSVCIFSPRSPTSLLQLPLSFRLSMFKFPRIYPRTMSAVACKHLRPRRFAPLDPAQTSTAPPLKGIVFDVDGTLW